MKKSIKLIMSLVMVVILTVSLSVNVFAAKEMFSLGSLKLSVDEPAVGKALDWSVAPDSTAVDIENVLWLEEDQNGNMTQLYSGAKAKPGCVYILQLEADYSTNRFAADITDEGNVTINGQPVDYIEVIGGTDSAPTRLFIEQVFPTLYENIYEAEIEIPVPEVGDKPYTGSISSSAFKSAGIEWYDKTAGKAMSSSETFKDGHTYEVTVSLKPLSGYFFHNSVTGWINSTKVATTFNDAELIYLKTTFILEHEHTESGWKTDSNKHWTICTECDGIMHEKESHNDGNKDGKCDICGAAVAVSSNANTNKPEESKAEESKADTTGKDNNKNNNKDNNKDNNKNDGTNTTGENNNINEDDMKGLKAIIGGVGLIVILPIVVVGACWIIAIIAIIKNAVNKKKG